MCRCIPRTKMFFLPYRNFRTTTDRWTDGSGVFGVWIFVLGTSVWKLKYRVALGRSIGTTGIRRVISGIIPMKIRRTIRAYPLISQSESVSVNPKENDPCVPCPSVGATPLEIGSFLKVRPISRNLWNPRNTGGRDPVLLRHKRRKICIGRPLN